MRTFWKGIAAAALGIAMTAGASSATTVYYEGGGPGIQSDAPTADFVLGDFGRNPARRVIEVNGDVSLYGGILHRSPTRYQDAWTFDFGAGSYSVVFEYFRTTRRYNGELTVGGTNSYVLADAGTIDLGNLTGQVTFLIDATAYGRPREKAHWNVQVAAVPLPAGAALLLTGLGGLAIARRRRGQV